MMRWVLFGAMLFGTGLVGAAIRGHVPHLVLLGVIALLMLPTGLLMEANLDRRRERRRRAAR